MKEWFDNLQPRERWVLIVGAAVALVIIGWNFIWVPLAGGAAELRRDVAAKERLLINLRRVEAIPAARPQAPRTRDGSFLVLVQSTGQAHGLTFTQQQPAGPDAITVTFQNVSFDDLAAWLIRLNTEHQVSVETARFSGTRQEGLVSGQLDLRRG